MYHASMMTSSHPLLTLGILLVMSISTGLDGATGNGEMTIKDFTYLLNLMDLRSGSTVITVHDHPLGQNYTQLLNSWMSKKGIKQLVFTLDMVENMLISILKQVIQTRSLRYYKSVLNIVTLCYHNCLKVFLKQLSMIDILHGQGFLIRHFAKVLAIYLNKSVRHFNFETDLDHLAVAFKDQELSASTLLWTKEGRSWASVGNISKRENGLMNTELFPNVHRGLNGRSLTIVAMEWTRFCREDSRSPADRLMLKYMCKDLTEYLAKKLNFTYVFVHPSEMKWGEQLPDNSWDGLLGMISRNEADFAVVPFGRTLRRVSAVSFSSIVLTSSYKVVYLKEFSERKDWVALVSGFKWEVYTLGLLTAIWCVALTLSLEKAVEKLNTMNKNISKGQGMQRIFDTLAVSIQRGSEYMPNSSSQRILLAAWCLFCVIMTTVYTGNLVAFLAVSKERIPFRTLEELADNYQYKVLIQHGSFIEDMLKVSHLPVHKKLWKRALESRTMKFESVREEDSYLEQQLQAGKSALTMLSEQLQDVQQRIHSIGKMQGEFMSIDMRLPFPLNSPLEPLISDQLMRMYDAGVLDGLKKKWFSHQPSTARDQHPTSQLEMNDLKSAFTACAIGIFLACVSLSLEKLYQAGIICNKIT